MQTRTPLIAGNWKMQKTIGEALALVNALRSNLSNVKAEIVVAPTYTALSKVAECLQGSNIGVAAQDLFWEDFGAYTGAISAPLIKDAGAKYVIIGHSERRQFFGETDVTVNKKIKAALKHQLIPILCVGETLAEREGNLVQQIIEEQVSRGLYQLTQVELKDLVIAYEPVWAIGTGKTATPAQAEETHVLIRNFIAAQFSQEFADRLRILYGGSVKVANCKELLALKNIDGALIGGASLNAEEFSAIAKSVA
ncbi:MAG: triose-phosphate isomerase [Gammaproteobacteria bacterium]|nr:triose-phosphate isomerase [Gammaproteobacteria bacterium]